MECITMRVRPSHYSTKILCPNGDWHSLEAHLDKPAKVWFDSTKALDATGSTPAFGQQFLGIKLIYNRKYLNIYGRRQIG